MAFVLGFNLNLYVGPVGKQRLAPPEPAQVTDDDALAPQEVQDVFQPSRPTSFSCAPCAGNDAEACGDQLTLPLAVSHEQVLKGSAF